MEQLLFFFSLLTEFYVGLCGIKVLNHKFYFKVIFGEQHMHLQNLNLDCVTIVPSKFNIKHEMVDKTSN